MWTSVQPLFVFQDILSQPIKNTEDLQNENLDSVLGENQQHCFPKSTCTHWDWFTVIVPAIKYVVCERCRKVRIYFVYALWYHSLPVYFFRWTESLVLRTMFCSKFSNSVSPNGQCFIHLSEKHILYSVSWACNRLSAPCRCLKGQW